MLKRIVVSGTKMNDVLTGTNWLNILFGKKGDDVLDGRGGTDLLFGGKGDDKLLGGDGKDFLFGGNGNDKLFGGNGNDFLSGDKGNDKLFGGSGNDFLSGGKGNDKLFGGKGNDKLYGGDGNDFLDGGAGSDHVFGDKGDDTLNFTWSENKGAKDTYDGGKGYDTLQLTLSADDSKLASVQKDITDFKTFLARKADSHSDDGKVFQFKSLGLNVRNFEALEIVEVGGGNTAPVADDDSFSFNEDTPTALDVLNGDTDADEDSLSIVNLSAPANGTLSLVDGVLTYTPTLNFNGSDSFTYQVSDGTALSNVATVSLTINPVNDAPVAEDDHLGNLTATKIVSPINVAVIGGAGIQGQQSTYVDVVNDLNLNPAMFTAKGFAYARDYDWTELLTYDVVVIGDSSGFDYADEKEDPATLESGTLFTTLEGFVKSGGGVVTTGLFASALQSIFIPTNGMSIDVQQAADFITPITPDGVDFAFGSPFGSSVINVIPGHEEIVGDVAGGQYSVQGITHEVAIGFDGKQVANFGAFTAIAYDDFGTAGGGRTVYLGTAHLAAQTFPFDPSATRDGPVDQIFEQAIAWAAGARGATVTIDSETFFRNVNDVDSPRDGFTIESFGTPGVDGASVAFVGGNIVYTLGAQSLQDLMNGIGVSDTFEYTMNDGDNGSATASVTLSIDNLL